MLKPIKNAQDLAAAYSSEVAEEVRAIAQRPEAACENPAASRSVAVITNGTAVRSLGDVAALASFGAIHLTREALKRGMPITRIVRSRLPDCSIQLRRS